MKTITFYSYKGGVGRTLALANIATRLAEFKKKVCLLDFDLEAPGLQFKFANFPSTEIKQGIVDYIIEFSEKGHLPQGILKFSNKIYIDNNKNFIYLIPAGDVNSKDYWKKLSSINWNRLLYEDQNGIAFFLDLKEKIKNEINPDFLLIDSRTGISEMSGITLSIFADEVVVVAANNKENLIGSKKIISSLSNPENILLEKPPKLRFVLSRIPFKDEPTERAKEQELIEKIKNDYLSPHVSELTIIHSDRELELEEKIKIGYKKDDSSAQISTDYLNLFEILTKDDLSEEEIKIFRNLKEAERLYAKSIDENSWAKKLDIIEEAIRLNGKSLDYKFYKSVVLKVLTRFDEAQKVLREIISQNEKYKDAYNLLGQIFYEQGQIQASIVQFERVIDMFGDDIIAYWGLGNAYSNTDPDTAIEYYSKVINLSPSSYYGYNNRADSYRKLKKYDLALKDIYKALELNSDQMASYFTLAQIFSDQNRKDDVYLTLELALKFDKNKSLEKEILSEKTFRKYFFEERFLKLLSKYNISIPLEILEKSRKEREP